MPVCLKGVLKSIEVMFVIPTISHKLLVVLVCQITRRNRPVSGFQKLRFTLTLKFRRDILLNE